MARHIYIAIMKAAATGVGLSLSADECFELSMDDAIATVAINNLEADEFTPKLDWKKINPARKRKIINHQRQ